MNDREACIALNMMEGVGPVGVRGMVGVVGSAAAIFEAGREVLLGCPGMGPGTVDGLLRQRTAVDWRGELERAAALGAVLVTGEDEAYPAALTEIHDPPLALYVAGTLKPEDRHAVAVVGTRRPTHYGRETAERLGFQLARAGYTVVSGLAEGIDTCAHRGALKAGGRTLAVIGSGLDCLYPASNRDLAREIARQGAVLSEFPLGRRPDKTTFPMRNRVVSGLARSGVAVVEAGLRSGALITAREAAEQGRTVYAVPGRVDSRASAGCHALIREGATLIRGVDDILEDHECLLAGAGRPVKEAAARPVPALTDDEEALKTLLDEGPRDVDSLIRASGLDAARIGSLLIGLEMKRMVRMRPGRMVEIVS